MALIIARGTALRSSLKFGCIGVNKAGNENSTLTAYLTWPESVVSVSLIINSFACVRYTWPRCMAKHLSYGNNDPIYRNL